MRERIIAIGALFLVLSFLFPTNAFSQNAGYTITGVVLDAETHEPLIGATVKYANDNSKGVITNVEGKFTLSAESSKAVEIVVSYIGYKDERVSVKPDKKPMEINLTTNASQMAEVVKVGYFQRDKKTFTGAANTYSSDDLKAISDRNVLSTLSAVDPSFQMVQNISMGSDPNTVPNIQVRGMNSLPDASGLSGGAMSLNEQYKGTSNLPTFILDGFEVDVEKIYDLDPNRVERISILKDASATAVYGSRAANGVVVIETKSPTRGRLRLNYNGTLDMEIADLSHYNLLNASEKLEYERLAGLYNGSSSVYVQEDYLKDYNERLKLVSQGINTNWLTKPLKSVGVGTKHSLMVEGGSDSFRYNVSLNYNNTQGVMKGSDRVKLGTGAKFMYNYKNLRFQNELTYDNVSSHNSPYGSFSTYTYMNPYYDPYDATGHLRQVVYESSNGHAGTQRVANPMYNSTLNTEDSQSYNDFVDNFSAEWNITTNLKLKGTFSIEHIDRKSDVFMPADHTNFLQTEKNKGSYTRGHSRATTLDGSAVVSYFNEWHNHTLSLNGGWNIQTRSSDYDGYSVYGFPNQQLNHPSFGTTFLDGQIVSGDSEETRLMGFLMSANYSWMDRYFVDLSGRVDGSSQFGSKQRWGAFWSAGAGWNLHQEKFVQNAGFINQLRLRASIGYTGGQNFYPYQSMKMYQYKSDLSYQGYIGAILKSYGNDSLKWQRTQKTNVGVDFSFFKERVSGYVNWYIENSKDLLVDINMMSYLGFDTYKENLGEIQNTGVEFNLKVTALKTKDWRLNVYCNGQHYRNTLKKISSGLTSYNDRADTSGSTAPYLRYVEGASINTIWVVPSKGIDPATGEEVFVKRDGTITNTWSQSDYVPYASADPKLAGTFGVNLYYKGWELNANFYYQFGGYAYNQTLVDKVENVDPYGNVDRRALYDRWSTPGEAAQFKAISDLTKTRPTSRFVERDNLLRANTLSLAYSMPKRWIKKIGAEYLKITLYANDFLYLSTIRREVGTSYPFSRHFSCSAQIAF